MGNGHGGSRATRPAAEPAAWRISPPRASAIALIVIASIATIAALRWSAGLFVPLVLSVLAAFALDAPVRWLERLRLPRAVAAAIVVALVVAGTTGGIYALWDEVAAAAQRLPEATETLRSELRELRGAEPGALDALGEAAGELEAAATEAAGAQARAPRPVQLDLGLREWVVVGSMSAVGWTGQMLLLVFFVYFLLASDDMFKRKLVRLAGPTLGARRVTVTMLESIHRSMERFILVTIAMNAVVAVVTFAAFTWLGVSYAPLWGVVGGTLNTIPYIGSAAATAIFVVVGLVEFGTLPDALAIGGVFLAITSIEGMLLKPWFIGRTAQMNNVAIFAGLIFWGWIWGAWGMLLAYPIMMVIKVVSDHDEALTPVAELLGD